MKLRGNDRSPLYENSSKFDFYHTIHPVFNLVYFRFVLTIITLCCVAFMAGFIDSIVGGGGLIQLPALMVFLPGYPAAFALGTNKFVAVGGTGMATGQYARRLNINWRAVLPMAITCMVSSYVGAHIVSSIKSSDLRPVIIVLLIVMGIFVYIKKDFGIKSVPRLSSKQQFWASIAAGLVIGFYDGFFGPGAGSFYIAAFIAIFGYEFLMASACAKVVNLASATAGVISFAITGNILYGIGLPMLVFNLLGGAAGSRLAMWKGSRFVRVLFLIVMVGIILKLSYDTFLA